MTTTAGKWAADSTIPHSGWKFLKMRDLQPRRKKCEMQCGANIRYAHLMRHPATGLKMEVGCKCAGNMEENKAAADARQKSIEATGRRVNKRAETLTKNRKAFSRINIDTGLYSRLVDAVIPALHRLQTEGQHHLKKAEEDSALFESAHFADQVLAHQDFLTKVEVAIARARSRIPDLLPLKVGEDLRKELSDARRDWPLGGWRKTRKGHRFETSQGDVAQLYEKSGAWWGLIVLAGAEEPTRHGHLGTDLKKAASKCIDQLAKDLHAAGRLPAAR